MHISHASLSVLPLFSYVLSTAAASLSRPSPITSDDIFPIFNGSVGERLSVPLTTSVPFAYRNILFDFTFFGGAIPKREVETLLTSADEAITDFVDEHPFDSIANNRFEHRAPGGNTLISIQANVGKSITWTQLFQMLQGLYRFMIGIGVRQQHCQVLDFFVAMPGQESVGLGVVRYFPRNKDRIQRRGTVSASIPGGTVLQLPNGSSSLPASTVNAMPLLWPIPKTSLVLSIHYVGIPIPEQNVKATLQGAMAEVRPWSTSEDRDEAIHDGAFDWTLPPNGDGTRTGVTVLAYHNCIVSWKQLSEVLFGLYQFTTAFHANAEQHFQVLGFRIINKFQLMIGVGTLSYYPRRLAAVEKRASNAGQDSLQLLTLTSPALAAGATQSSILWSVRDTIVVLDIVFLGQHIPNLHIIEALGSAQKYIANIVREQPHAPIINDRFNFKPEGSDAYINIVTTHHRDISWLELSQVLFGVMQFCEDEHQRVLVFDIDIGGMRVGFGTLLYFEPDSPNKVEKRTVNGTLTLPNLVAGSTSISYNIPNTRDYLDFKSFGKAIPSSQVLGALAFVLNDISEFVQGIPNSPVPRNRYVHNDVSGVSVAILPSTFNQMTWSQLDEILTGLMCFVTGVNPRPGPNLKTRYQVLEFNMILQKQGYIGTGMLGYKPPLGVEVEKPDAVDNESVLQLPGSNTTTNITYPSTVPFHVPGTPMTLLLTPLSDPVPSQQVLAMLAKARAKLVNSVARRPDSRVARNWFEYSTTLDERGGAAAVLVHAYVGHDLTWSMVDDVFAGLIDVLTRGTGKYLPSLRFEVDLEEVGRIGLGTLWYTPGRRLISRATLNPAKTLGIVASAPATSTLDRDPPQQGEVRSSGNLSVPGIDQSDIRFPIVHTNITLIFTKLGVTKIPIATVNDLFHAVTEDIQSSVATSSNSAIPGPLWYFKVDSVRGGATLSISIYTGTNHILTWLQLRKILSGLEVFMVSQRFPLDFDIEMGTDTEVGKGVIWYSPPRSLGTNTAAKSAFTQLPQSTDSTTHPPPLVLPIPYPIPSTPMTLTIYLNGPLIPLIYLSAYLTTALRHIRANATTIPDAPIPGNTYAYSEPMSGLTLNYLGYSDDRSLTWQQLSWILQGLLGFTSASEAHCRAMAVEVDVEGVRVGGFVLWFAHG